MSVRGGVRVLRFGAVSALLIVLVALVAGRVFRLPDDDRALRVAAVAAFVVQMAGFGLVAVVRRTQPLFTAWSAGMLLRFIALVVMAFVVVRALDLRAEPALVGFVCCLFVTTLVEPLFLQ